VYVSKYSVQFNPILRGRVFKHYIISTIIYTTDLGSSYQLVPLTTPLNYLFGSASTLLPRKKDYVQVLHLDGTVSRTSWLRMSTPTKFLYVPVLFNFLQSPCWCSDCFFSSTMRAVEQILQKPAVCQNFRNCDAVSHENSYNFRHFYSLIVDLQAQRHSCTL
jgi:hypothetical protein